MIYKNYVRDHIHGSHIFYNIECFYKGINKQEAFDYPIISPKFGEITFLQLSTPFLDVFCLRIICIIFFLVRLVN